MSQTLNELRSNNTSGVPGLRLNKRRGHLVVDVSFYIEKRYSTSFLVETAGPITAVARAMFYREKAVGAIYEITPRQAWNRLKRTQPA